MARFDWKTPGTGLSSQGITDPVAYFDAILDHSATAKPTGITNFGLAGAAMSANPGLAESMGTQALDLSTQMQWDNAQKMLADFMEYAGGADLASLTPAQKANIIDQIFRDREQKNQMPKRGLEIGPLSISPGMIAAGLFAAPFALGGTPLTSAIGGAVAGAGSGDPLGVLMGGATGFIGGGGLGDVGKVGKLFGAVPNPNSVPGGATGVTTPSGISTMMGGTLTGGTTLMGGGTAGAAAGAAGAGDMAGLGSWLLDLGSNVAGSAAGGLTQGLISDWLSGDAGDRALNAVGDVGGAVAALDPNKVIPNVTAGGLTSTMRDGRITVLPDSIRQSHIANIMGGLNWGVGQTGQLMSQVAPGFGKITESRVSTIENAKRAAIGNLKDSLARRRIAGSSFANDTLSRAEAEFSKQTADAKAQSFMEEMDYTNKLMQQKVQLHTQMFETALSELGIEGDMGLSLATNGIGALQGLARSQAEILANAATNRGTLLAQSATSRSDLLNPALAQIGTSVASGVSSGISELTDWFRGK